ncbi:Mercuric reductase [Methylobacterium crusticola]|uniref:Mercuric reductase n=1 Tax=Methylobacterium crusticola TaxID=1697972 RepID=A0ABQ4QRX4_9HYPH|nr:FAD-dependent oxidoreductase [Methylobacterium crusticola]GJD48068.1 Mercuric reductase [Methylobacterium crusticola]
MSPDPPALACDVCVIGAGSAGLSVAAGTSRLGLRTVLVEEAEMGGDCLNRGCVPSKALLAAARAAGPGPAIPGVAAPAAAVDFAAVADGVADVIAAIAPHDSAARFEGLGATVLRGRARFLEPRTLRIGRQVVRAARSVIATGSRPAIPAIPGLDPARVLTNATLFGLRERPAHLLILGGGPVGIEMAQAHRRLGCAVTLVQRRTILPRDEPDLVAILRARLEREGVRLVEHAAVARVAHGLDEVVLTLERGGAQERLAGSHLLVAAGRQANVEDLGLDAAGVAYGPEGIAVDRRLRTSRRGLFALGDVVAGGPRYTHAAGYQAGIVVRNLAFRLPARVEYRALPRVTYTDPELAQVGLTEAEARARGEVVTVLTQPLSRNDRAVAERRPEGAVKLVAGRRGRILGAAILGPAAGEVIGLWCLAIAQGLSLRAVSGTILPYPTIGEAARAAAGAYYAPALFGPRTRRLVDLLRRLPG